ncbi:MAG: helix-turn-helix transcriptional regulator [Pseudomonadales bacterium]|nr:helix-turn-helix transcriptional regulator [Pseudomonadales bacterium]
MIKCNLSRYMGEQKMNISDVARLTSLNRSTISLLYHEKATRIELEAIESLCKLFHCEVGDLFQLLVEEKD